MIFFVFVQLPQVGSFDASIWCPTAIESCCSSAA